VRITRIIFALSTIVSLQSCRDDLTNSPQNQPPPFSLSISVVDATNSPVPNLRISSWSKLALIAGLLPVPPDTLPRTLASSTIMLDMPTRAKVWMALYDMDNRIVLALYSDNTLWGPGMLRTTFVTGEYRTPRVLKCRCIVQDSLSTVLYRDSIYSLCWQPYAERSILGWTSNTGTWSSRDSLTFPNVLTLPSLVHTGGTGWDTLGTFSLSDTLIFVLTDTSTHRQQFVEAVVRNGTQDSLRFVWQPTLQTRPMERFAETPSQGITVEMEKVSTVVAGWRLHQNYPNPYFR
jgi:hypothetical protein